MKKGTTAIATYRPAGATADLSSLAHAFNEMRGDYNAMRQSRFRKRLTGVVPSGSHADYHYRSEADYLRMMELSRAIVRNDIVVGQGIERVVASILQSGFTLDPQTGSEELNAAMAQRWKVWSESKEQVSKSRQHNLHELATFTLRAVIVDGDLTHIAHKDGSLETIEAHRLRTPGRVRRNVVHGILLDKYRKRLEYWFTNEDVGTSQRAGLVIADMTQLPGHDKKTGVQQVFFVHNPKRVTQTRGVSALAPCVDTVGMHDDVQFSQLVKQQMASCVGLIENVPEETDTVSDTELGERRTETLDDGTSRIIEGIAPGMRYISAPGHQLSAFSPDIPNAEFFPHSMLILTFIAVNIGLPVHALLLDPSKTNFSGWRGAMNMAREGFKWWQGIMTRDFYSPVYKWKTYQWLTESAQLRKLAGYKVDRDTGLLIPPDTMDVDIFRHRFSAPRWAYIEPNKDTQAAKTTVDDGLNSRRNVLADMNLDIEEVDRHIIADRERAIMQAMEAEDRVATKYPGKPVSYLYFLPPNFTNKTVILSASNRSPTNGNGSE